MLTSDPLNRAGRSLGKAETAMGLRHKLAPESLGFYPTRWQIFEIFLWICSSVTCFVCQMIARLNKVSTEGDNVLFLLFTILF